jgi:hypothetical protein
VPNKSLRERLTPLIRWTQRSNRITALAPNGVHRPSPDQCPLRATADIRNKKGRQERLLPEQHKQEGSDQHSQPEQR